MRILLALFLLAGAHASARSLESDIKRILAKSDVVRTGFAGVLVVDEKGHTVVSINPGHLFTPASNTKLFSTALALERLGPEKRFETRVEMRGKDLALIGTGDANLSMAVLDELAAQVAAHGIHTIEGDILGDDTAFLYEPYAPSWTMEDTVDGDGPATSALVVNNNVIHLHLQPRNELNAPAAFALDPNLPLFPLHIHVTTGAETHIESRRPGEAHGTIKAGAAADGAAADKDAYTEEWSVGDPALFAALAFKDALQRAGIVVNGSIRGLHRDEEPATPSAGELLALHQSPPLIDDLRLTNKISQNLHADLLLADVAGSRSAGLQALADFLSHIGIPPSEFHFYDGSGLSRSTLVTPDAVVALIRYMAHSAHAEQWFATLPISGVDGSLEHRLTGPRTKGRIRAKTGTLAHVSALSGYAEARHEKTLTFSIFVNNTFADAEQRRELIDRICAELTR